MLTVLDTFVVNAILGANFVFVESQRNRWITKIYNEDLIASGKKGVEIPGFGKD